MKSIEARCSLCRGGCLTRGVGQGFGSVFRSSRTACPRVVGYPATGEQSGTRSRSPHLAAARISVLCRRDAAVLPPSFVGGARQHSALERRHGGGEPHAECCAPQGTAAASIDGFTRPSDRVRSHPPLSMIGARQGTVRVLPTCPALPRRPRGGCCHGSLDALRREHPPGARSPPRGSRGGAFSAGEIGVDCSGSTRLHERVRVTSSGERRGLGVHRPTSWHPPHGGAERCRLEGFFTSSRERLHIRPFAPPCSRITCPSSGSRELARVTGFSTRLLCRRRWLGGQMRREHLLLCSCLGVFVSREPFEASSGAWGASGGGSGASVPCSGFSTPWSHRGSSACRSSCPR